MRILLLSAYDADSHRRWRKGLVAAFPNYQWTVLALPARYFSWRVRGNSLSWAYSDRATLEADYDVLIATSMVDLSALRGMVPKLSAIPTLVYFHENQFSYPKSRHQFSSVEPQILNLYTALCADSVVFNSDYNRDSFLLGVSDLMVKLPDHVPSGIVDQLSEKSSVLPVPLESGCFDFLDQCLSPHQPITWRDRDLNKASRPLRIVWAARFEYDKGGDRLLLILNALKQQGVAFELALLGQSFRHSPAEFQQIAEQFNDELVQFGYEPSLARFRLYLSQADVVLSTAIHEFQGLAVLEAVAAGCVPVVPARLAYAGMYPSRYQYHSEEKDLAAEASAAVNKIVELWCAMQQGENLAHDVSDYYWSAQKTHYQAIINGLI